MATSGFHGHGGGGPVADDVAVHDPLLQGLEAFRCVDLLLKEIRDHLEQL
jgi:hypothetical protein